MICLGRRRGVNPLLVLVIVIVIAIAIEWERRREREKGGRLILSERRSGE